MQIQLDPLLQFLDSVDLVKRVLTLRLVLRPAMYEDLGYASFQEMYQVTQPVTREALEDESAPASCAEQEDQIVTVDFTLNDTVGKIVNEQFTKAAALLKKAGKTEQQSAQALEKVRSAQKPIEMQQLKILKKLSTPAWFEKFHWFISSDGYLVVGGRDAQQNEILVKRFMSQNDIFVHADIHGAPCVVIKMDQAIKIEDPQQSQEIEFIPRIPPETTLREAASLSVCHSSAWESRLAQQAYYVFGTQVTKTAPTGTYISTGSFIIKGTKHYINVYRLEYGVGLLWKYQEEQPFQPSRLHDQKNQQFYLSEYAHKDDNMDAPSDGEAVQNEELQIMTKKQKTVQVKAVDTKKLAEKQEKKADKKARQEKIKQ